MTFEERKAALKRGAMAAICRRLDRSPAHVHYVLKGERRDAPVERAIAERIGKSVSEVFGESKS